MTAAALAVFKGKSIRRTLHQGEWWFSLIDVIEALTGTDRARKYWSDLKNKLETEGYSEVSDKIGQLKLESSDGKKYETDCATAETLFRIIQRKQLEKQSGKRVVSRRNYLPNSPRKCVSN